MLTSQRGNDTSPDLAWWQQSYMWFFCSPYIISGGTNKTGGREPEPWQLCHMSAKASNFTRHSNVWTTDLFGRTITLTSKLRIADPQSGLTSGFIIAQRANNTDKPLARCHHHVIQKTSIGGGAALRPRVFASRRWWWGCLARWPIRCRADPHCGESARMAATCMRSRSNVTLPDHTVTKRKGVALNPNKSLIHDSITGALILTYRLDMASSEPMHPWHQLSCLNDTNHPQIYHQDLESTATLATLDSTESSRKYQTLQSRFRNRNTKNKYRSHFAFQI